MDPITEYIIEKEQPEVLDESMSLNGAIIQMTGGKMDTGGATLLLATGVVALLILKYGIKAYKKYLTKAAISCRNAENKRECMMQFKKKAFQYEISVLKQSIKYCKRTKSPNKCEGKVKDKIIKLQNNIKSLA